MACPVRLLDGSYCSYYVTLWHHNAKMILWQYALSLEDDLVFGQVANVV